MMKPRECASSARDTHVSGDGEPPGPKGSCAPARNRNQWIRDVLSDRDRSPSWGRHPRRKFPPHGPLPSPADGSGRVLSRTMTFPLDERKAVGGHERRKGPGRRVGLKKSSYRFSFPAQDGTLRRRQTQPWGEKADADPLRRTTSSSRRSK